MPLEVKTKSPTYDLTITIDDEPVLVHIARMTKAQLIAFERNLRTYDGPLRSGDRPPTEAEKTKHEDEARDFCEESIRAYVSFEPGDVVDEDGLSIITGAQIVSAFVGRKDVLGACLKAIYSEHCLGKAAKNILSSQRTFSPGSTPSTKAASGAAPVLTAGSAANSGTAASAAVTEHAEPALAGARS